MQTKDSITFSSSIALTLANYVELTKPKVVLLLVFTAIVGMLLASDNYLQLQVLLFGSLGIGLSAASGAVINHIYDLRIDSKMSRTSNRPLPTGKISEEKALIFAFFLGWPWDLSRFRFFPFLSALRKASICECLDVALLRFFSPMPK